MNLSTDFLKVTDFPSFLVSTWINSLPNNVFDPYHHADQVNPSLIPSPATLNQCFDHFVHVNFTQCTPFPKVTRSRTMWDWLAWELLKEMSNLEEQMGVDLIKTYGLTWRGGIYPWSLRVFRAVLSRTKYDPFQDLQTYVLEYIKWRAKETGTEMPNIDWKHTNTKTWEDVEEFRNRLA